MAISIQTIAYSDVNGFETHSISSSWRYHRFIVIVYYASNSATQ